LNTGSTARRSRAALAALLALATFALYARVAGHQFLHFDDDQYLTANPVVAAGWTAAGVRWAFTTFSVANWHPLAWLSHMLDVQLFGMRPGPHHLVNAGIHAANGALLFLVLARMTGATALAFLAAALFALHPVHVESVAWVSERKDVLSTLFGLLLLGAYAHHAARPSLLRYLAVLLLLAASLMAKAMWITAPFLLLLLDYWPLQRFAARPGPEDPRPPRVPRFPAGRLVLEKLPLLVLCAAVGAVAVVAQDRGGALESLARLPFADRVGNAARSYLAYLAQAFWPASLSAYYPMPPAGSVLRPVAAVLALAGATAVTFLARRRQPWLLVGWLWYLGMLVPVIGLVQVGSQAMADRYTYVPLVGISVALIWTLDALVQPRAARTGLALAAGLAIASLAALTWIQIGYWRDQVSLFSHAVAVTGENGRAHHLLSQGFIAEQRWPEALVHAREAARLDPENPRAHKNLGFVLFRNGRLDEAIASLERAVALDPGYAEAHGNLAIAYGRAGRTEDAVREMRIEMQLRAAAPR
jgi:tetratricopeptide (TPR) repeat protein